MKVDFLQIGKDLEAAALPMAEKDVVIAVDAILMSLKKQADEQVGDVVAGVVSLAVPEMKMLVDAALAKFLPGSQG